MDKPREKIWIFTDWFKPGYRAGGPIVSVYNMCLLLAPYYDIRVITSDTDLGADAPYPDITSDIWVDREGYHVLYLSAQTRTLRGMHSIIREIDSGFLYFNSVFSFWFTLLPLWLSKRRKDVSIVLAPRGMLGKGPLHIKRRKKQLFLMVAKVGGLFRSVCWHASTTQESTEVQAVFGKSVRIAVARNVIGFAEEIPPVKKPFAPLRVVFSSRISPVKNLEAACRWLTKLRVPFEFDIYGPMQDATYFESCRRVLEEGGVRYAYKGELEHHEVRKTLANYHYFLLPTYNENFGHSILEAMSVGLLPIISDKTPWSDLEEAKAGFVVPLERADTEWARVAQRIVGMDAGEYARWSANARSYLKKLAEDPQVLRDHLALFG
jgi:glycosyltransferase involved in cell wall biosynthesis